MSTVIENLERAQLRRVPRFDAGDRVRVHFQVIEGTRRRTQVFEGVVIKRQGHGARETFTVRKQSFGVGVERTFPLHSPKIERIEIASRGDVRRAKLYYLRDRVGKRARVRERRNTAPEEAIERELLYAEDADLEAVAEAAPEAVADPTAEPDAEVVEPEAEVVEPEAEVAEPEAEVVEPEAEVVEPEAEVVEPEAEVAEPGTEVAEPEAAAEQDTAAVDSQAGETSADES